MKKRHMQAAIEEYNRAVPIGTEVIVTKDDGKKIRTKTRSAAWVLGGHTPVIMIEGVTGCFLLDRIEIIEENGKEGH